MKRYRVAQVGVGNRGVIHLDGFRQNADRFEVVALCDLDAERLQTAAETFGIADTYADAETMLAATRPDVFCFVTQPAVRLEMVQLAARHRVKGLAFEKPMATSLAEAKAIADLLATSGIKAVVCHPHKYLPQMQRLKSILAAGEIGQVEFIRATCRAWLSQLGTHYMDYTLWINGGSPARWVVGHAHGRERLSDSHPSPDFILGEMLFENGVRAYLDCGYLSPQRLADDAFWFDDRLAVFGTHGYAWAECNGRWGAFTRSSGGEVQGGEEICWIDQEKHHVQAPYTKDLAHWLDDDARVHPCNVAVSYHGFETLEGLCTSALDRTRVDLPLDPAAHHDALERMRRELPDVPPLA